MNSLGVVILALVGECYSFTMPTVSRTYLDFNKLAALNTEVRTALLNKVNAELHSAEVYMTSLEPQLSDCQVKVNASLGDCAQCVDTECQKRFQNCPTISINMQTQGGSSISTTNNKVTICSLMGLSHTCQVIMDPSGFMMDGVSQIGNSLNIHFHKLSHDLGNGAVGNFINGLHSFYNGGTYNESGWSKADADKFNAQMQEMQKNLHNMGQQIQQSLTGSMGGLHQTLSNMGQSLQQWGTNFGQQLTQSLANAFQSAGPLFGRKKRAAQQECVALMSDVTSCSMFTAQCASCPSSIKIDLMKSVCGVDLVNKVQAAEKSMSEMDQISKEVMSTQNILIQVEGTQQPGQLYRNVVVTANIHSFPTVFTLPSDLDLSSLPAAGQQLAELVWKEWALMKAQQ